MSLLLVLLLAQAARPFAEERQLLDRQLETLRRMLPDGPTPKSDMALLKEAAEAAKLSGFDAVARPPSESGASGTVTIDVSGAARFAEIDRFFRQLALSVRPIDVESLELSATAERLVRFGAVVRFPYRPARAALPAPPQGARRAVAGAPRVQADAYVRDQALAVAKSEAIATLRRTRRNPRLFLSELSAIVRDRPVVLSEARLGEDFSVRGLTIGEAPSRALESRFERGFLRVSQFLMVRQGACRRFEVRGTAPVAGPDAELPLPSEDPFGQQDASCLVDRDAERGLTLQQAPAKGKPGTGSLALRLRDVDLADVFYAIHLASGLSFLVDADVAGRTSLDVSQLTLDELLSLLRRNGLRISDAGLVRRVSRAAAASRPTPASPLLPASDPEVSAAKASFALKRADVRELLAVMTDMDAGFAALGPQGLLGRASLWTRELPLGELRRALLEAAGLKERSEEGRRILYRPSAPEDPVFPVAGSPQQTKLELGPEELDVGGFELAGLVSSGNGWTALAYSPVGRLYAYRPGDRLADGVVTAVESTDVTLDTDSGTLHVVLPTLPR